MAIARLVAEIHEQFRQRKGFLAVFLDIDGAYDRAWHPAILSRLVKCKCPDYLILLIRSYLSDRQVEMTYKSGHYVKPLSLSCPQGGVLSPFLWNLIIDSLLDLLDELRVFNQAFADDSVFGVPGNWGEPEFLAEAEVILERIFEWGAQHHTSFNPSKIKLVYFDRITGRAKEAIESGISLCGKLYPLLADVRYLGVQMDFQLNWKRHVQISVGKVRKLIMACRPVVKKRWGLSTGILRKLYQAVFLPQLLFGSLGWAEVLDNRSLVEEMQKMLRVFSIFMTRALPQASGVVTMAMAGLVPVRYSLGKDIVMKLLMYKHGFDLTGYSAVSKYRIALERCLQRVNLPYETELDHRRRGDPLPPQRYKEIDYSLKELSTIVPPEPSTFDFDVYTDGSRDESIGTGCAFAVFDSVPPGAVPVACGQYQLSVRNSVFQAECGAIYQAVGYLNGRFADRRLTNRILADSKSAIQASVSPHSSSVISRAAYSAMAGSPHTFILQYVRAHCGIVGNEYADTLAKEACTTGTVFYTPISRTWCSTYIHNHLLHQWESGQGSVR